MELTKTTKVEDIEKIDFYKAELNDAIKRLVYDKAKSITFFGWTYKEYRERTKQHWDKVSNIWFDILWNLAIRYNKANFPICMEKYPDIKEKELVDSEDDFILLWIEDD